MIQLHITISPQKEEDITDFQNEMTQNAILFSVDGDTKTGEDGWVFYTIFLQEDHITPLLSVFSKFGNLYPRLVTESE